MLGTVKTEIPAWHDAEVGTATPHAAIVDCDRSGAQSRRRATLMGRREMPEWQPARITLRRRGR